MRRVVVTGMGAVTPIGNSVADFWESVKLEKKSSIRLAAFLSMYFSGSKSFTSAASLHL